MRTRNILLIGAAIFLGIGLAYIVAPSPKTRAAAGIVTSDCGEIQPTDMGIHWSDGSGTLSAQSSGITAEQAITIASANTIVIGQLPAPLTKTQRVSYSNDNRGIAPSGNVDDDDIADANAISQGVPAWIVSFCGVRVRRHIRPGHENDPNIPVGNEWNVVVNAVTGQVIEEFGAR